MTPERWARVKEIFNAAQEKPEAEQSAFLDEVSGSDASLREQVQHLFRERHHPDLESPVAGILSQGAPRLAAGSMLLHYQVEEKLGEGGMGVVYKARDTRLGRPVAIKVLREEFAQDRERVARFQREARLLASLNHPNIAAIHGLEESGEVAFLVLEHVPGKSLAQRVAQRPLPVREAIEVAIQMAEALEAAHEKGIIHRDLKPANIEVSDEGRVKVLDFGIAKALETESASDLSGTLTPVTGATERGIMLGTVAYMSPEQACGKPLDRRTDIWSFGCVLYEMITGRRAFQGDSDLSTLAAILKEEPKAASQVVKGVPREVERTIKRCLRKDPAQRFQHMADLRVELEELKEGCDSGTLETERPATGKPRGRILRLAAVGVIVALAVAGIWIFGLRTQAPDEALIAVPLTSYPGDEDSPSFSPDGTQVAFQWRPDSSGKSFNIYIKQIGTEPPSRLTDTTANEYSPAWSPDGRSIAFARMTSPGATRVSLVVVPQWGGRERVLAEFDSSPAGERSERPFLAWTPDSKWLICSVWGATERRWALRMVSFSTGQQRRLTSPPTGSPGDTAPAISPDGRTLVFARASDVAQRSDLFLLRLGEGYNPLGDPQKIRSERSWSDDPAWTPDGNEILYSSGTFAALGLWRMPVSRTSRSRILTFARESALAPAVSRKGNRLAYVVIKYDSNIWRVELDDRGRTPGAPAPFICSTRLDYESAFSPDGRRIAFVSDRSGNQEIWVCDRDGSNPVRLTSIGATIVRIPRWSPNGESLAFEADPGGNQDVYVVSASGGTARRLTTDRDPDQWPDWSPDGQSLYFVRGGRATKDIWKIPVAGGEAVQITRNLMADIPQVSPDGSFIYYSKGWPYSLSIWRVPANGGESSKVLEWLPPMTWWTVTEEGIYFVSNTEDKRENDLSIYEFATGKTRNALTLEGRFGDMAVSRDRRTILFTKLDKVGSDLMLVENFR